MQPGPSEDMIVHADITPADWTAFVRFVVRNVSRSSGARLGRWLSALGIGVAAGVACSVTGISLQLPSLLVGAAGVTLWLIIVSRLQMRRMVPAADGYILGPRRVSLLEDGLHEASQRHESFFPWHAIRGTQLTEQHMFVMVDNNAAIIVPRRAFSSDTEREQFIAEIQRRVTT